MNCNKRQLRLRMLEARAAVHGPGRSALVCAQALALPQYAAARVVLAYHSVGSEVDTISLIRRMRADGKIVCLPRVLGGGVMEARRMDGLIPGPLGIPGPEGPVLPPDAIDLILVPGLAFDLSCYRLGQGGGYYDRYLPGCRGFSVGLAYDCQVVDALPREAHDAQLDLVVTETTLYARP